MSTITTKICKDLLPIIASYLPFDEKVLFGKACDMNFLQILNFNNNPALRSSDDILGIFPYYGVIDTYDYFQDVQDEIMRYYWDTSGEIIEKYSIKIIEKYIAIKNPEKHDDSKSDWDNVDNSNVDNSETDITYNSDDEVNSDDADNFEDKNNSDDENDYNDENDSGNENNSSIHDDLENTNLSDHGNNLEAHNDEKNHLPYHNIDSDIHAFKHKDEYMSFEYYFDDIFNDSICYIHTKKIIEYIENNGIKIKNDKEYTYYDELNDQIPLNTILDKVCEYYMNALLYDDMNHFCYRCANFGHTSEDTICIFYNKDYVDKKKEEGIECVHCKRNQRKQICPEKACMSCCSMKHLGHGAKK